jgi:hypothetical protein
MGAWYEGAKAQCDEDKDVRAKCTQAYSDLNEQYNTTQGNYLREKSTAASKFDGWVLGIFFFLGFIGCYIFFYIVHRKVAGEFNMPSEIRAAMRKQRAPETLPHIRKTE